MALADLLRQTLENLDSGQGFSDKIRQGGQGSVVGPLEYNGQKVALKIFNYTGRPDVKKAIIDFEREYQSLKVLSHPSIVRFIAFDHIPQKNAAYLRMQWASTELSASNSGGAVDLGDIICHHDGLHSQRKKSLLPEAFIWHVLFHLSAALSLCHHGIEIQRKKIAEKTDTKTVLHRLVKNPPSNLRDLAVQHPQITWTTERITFLVKPSHEAIIHRDIKPRNVLLYDPPCNDHDEGWRMRVSLEEPDMFCVYPVILLGDFGLSAPLRVAQTVGIGSYGFTAPEIPIGPGRPDSPPFAWTTSCDIFSLGATLWNLMSLQTPPDSLPDYAALPELPASYSAELRNLVLKCYAVDKSARPTAVDILDECIQRGFWNETFVSPYGTLVSAKFHETLLQSWWDCLDQLDLPRKNTTFVKQTPALVDDTLGFMKLDQQDKYGKFSIFIAGSYFVRNFNSTQLHMNHITQHWIVPRSTNTMFIGRDQLLSELETISRDAVQDSSRQDQCRMVITGMGGQGKSEICLQLARRVRQLFWGVFWVDVSTPSLAESAFLDIASRLHISAQTWEDGRQGLVSTHRPWMLVLDNADDPRVDYQRYIPAGPSGIVILTSRNEQCKRFATEKYIPLDGLSDIEAHELLFYAADVPHDQRQTLRQDAQVVTSLLRSHPLALILAGSYVSRGHCTIAQYPGVFTQHRQRLLTFKLTQAQSRYRDVYATFEASADILQLSTTESAADALQLLPVLATCAPGRLPLPLFEAGWKGAQSMSPSTGDNNDTIRLTPWHVAYLLPLMQPDANTWDSFRLIEAVNLLKAFSLVSTDIHDGFLSVSMHPLTHAWARDRQEIPEQHESWVTTGCLMALSCEDDVLWQRHGRQLQPHVQALTAWEISTMFGSEPVIKITSILMKCGRLLYDMRDDAKIFVLMHNLLTHLSLDRQNVDRRWLEVYELTAWNLINYGKIKEAVSLLEQVVKIREQTLAEDHPARLASQQALARAYHANGQVKEAVSLLEQVIKIEEQTLTEDHPSWLASQHDLAMAYKANGQVKEAVSLLEQVVKIQKQTLAENHPDRLASQHALAIAYQANGQVKEALSLLEQVVKIREQTLAGDHPARLASQQALARAYEANGQVKEAVSLLEQVVKIQEQTLAEDHPDRLASQHALAIAYQANGQVKEALSLLEQVVKIREQTLAEDHLDRLASQQVMATMYWDLGRRNTALQMMRHVVEIRRQVLDERHPNRIGSESWLKQFEREIGT